MNQRLFLAAFLASIASIGSGYKYPGQTGTIVDDFDMHGRLSPGPGNPRLVMAPKTIEVQGIKIIPKLRIPKGKK